MTYAWARWLETALRSDPFVAARLIVRAGWETAGRPPPAFSFLPTGVIDHHTACFSRVGHDPQVCINTIMIGNSIAPGPISQLLGTNTPPGVKFTGSNWEPRIALLAAGRCNHAGAGIYPWGAPGGNGASIGIEWCGPVERWPDVVIELRERTTAAILRHNGWGVHQSTIHWEYATPHGRKIDPSGAYTPQPALKLLDHWSPDVWRQRIAKRLEPVMPPASPDPTPPITPPIPVEVDPMPILIQVPGDAAVLVKDGIFCSSVVSQTAIDRWESLGQIAKVTRKNGVPIGAPVARSDLASLTYVGRLPNYTGVGPDLPGRTVAADFAAHLPGLPPVAP